MYLRLGTDDPVDRQLPIDHVRAIDRITTASRTAQTSVRSAYSPFFTKQLNGRYSPSVIQQALHMLRCFSGREQGGGRKILIERARVLGASNMLAVRVMCVLVHVEDIVVDGGEDIALGEAIAAT